MGGGSQPGREGRWLMYPHDPKIPATRPCARRHARVWLSAGKVWLMLHDEPGEARDFYAGIDWPFAIDNSLPPDTAARRLTMGMRDAEQKEIRGPLASLIATVKAEFDQRLKERNAP